MSTGRSFLAPLYPSQWADWWRLRPNDIVERAYRDMSSSHSEKIYRRRPDLMSAALGDLQAGVVVLSTQRNAYFGLDNVAAFLWNCLEHPQTAEQLLQAVQTQYSVETEEAKADIETFITQLLDRGLVEVAKE